MMKEAFEFSNQVFVYDQDEHAESTLDQNNLKLLNDPNKVSWFNVYGCDHQEIAQLIDVNGFDEFLKILFRDDEEKNKLIDLDDSIYMSINVLLFENDEFNYDRIRFVFKDDLMLTIQEKKGDYFDGIRTFIREKKGIIRKRGTDYLMFKLIEAILDHYELAYKSFIDAFDQNSDITSIKPNPQVVLEIEQYKQRLLTLKSALNSMKEVLIQLENWDKETINNVYFSSLRESTKFLIEEIDMNLQMQDSKLNLIFNIQSHRLNEVMKTLTIFSVIFIPLTFLAGIYGMNFENMPELHSPNGYFILLGSMLIVVILIVIYFRRKKWF